VLPTKILIVQGNSIEENLSRLIKCRARAPGCNLYRSTQVTKCCGSTQSVVPESHLKCSACVCCNMHDLRMRSPHHQRLYLPKLSMSKRFLRVGPELTFGSRHTNRFTNSCVFLITGIVLFSINFCVFSYWHSFMPRDSVFSLRRLFLEARH